MLCDLLHQYPILIRSKDLSMSSGENVCAYLDAAQTLIYPRLVTDDDHLKLTIAGSLY